MKYHFFFFFILIFYFNTVSAAVNLVNGHFFHSQKIKLVAKSKLLITFNNNSSYSGLFGQGWCSELEQIYKPKLKVVSYCNNNLSKDIRRSKLGYFYKNKTNLYYFNKQGKLSRVCKDKICWKVNNSLSKLMLQSKNATITLNLNDKKVVSQIKSNDKTVARFKYRNGTLQNYYNASDNLRWRYSTQKRKLKKVMNDKGYWLDVKYDGSLVRSISDHKGCVENFTYKKTGAFKTRVVAELICSKKNIGQKDIEVTVNNNYNLKSIKDFKNKTVKSYHQNNQLISSLDSDKVLVNFAKSNQVKDIDLALGKKIILKYDYRQRVKLIKYREEGTKDKTVRFFYKNKKIKEFIGLSKIKTKFTYDKKNKLKRIQRANRSVKLNYQNSILKSASISQRGRSLSSFNLNGRATKQSAINLAKFLNEVFDDVGEAVEYVPELKELF